MQRTLLEEHIGLVDQDDGLPRGHDVEHTFERVIEGSGGRSQVSSTDEVQRAANVFGGGFGGESLAYEHQVSCSSRNAILREQHTDTRRPEEVDNETMTLALDEVVETELAMVSFDEGLEELLASFWKDEVGERVFVPLNVLDKLDVELDWRVY